MQGLRFAKEPSRNAVFCSIAQLANMLLDILALNWCKNVASETGLGKCVEPYSMLFYFTYPYSSRSNLHDTVILIIVSHSIKKKIALLQGEISAMVIKKLPGKQHFGVWHCVHVCIEILI